VPSGVRTSFSPEKPAPALGLAGLLLMLASLSILGLRKTALPTHTPR